MDARLSRVAVRDLRHGARGPRAEGRCVVSAAQRVKGRRGEAEVAGVLRSAGFTVRGLERGGDHLAVGHAVRLHIEVKRQERGFRAAWARQAQREAPEDAAPLVVYRRSREPWRAAVMLRDAGLWMMAGGFYAPADYSLHNVDGEWWAHANLLHVLAGIQRAE